MKYVIIHGTLGHPEENRIPRLKSQLESKGHTVYVPHFPTPENQNLTSRCAVLQEQALFVFDEETILIGHSLGALYILHILEMERSKKIQASVLVSGFTRELGIESFDTINAAFLKDDFNWERIRGNVEHITLFHGENDPYVSMEQTKRLQEMLECELLVIPNGGHLNENAGYGEFDELLRVVS